MRLALVFLSIVGCDGSNIVNTGGQGEGDPEDSAALTTDTGWPQLSGEDFVYAESSSGELVVHFNDEQELDSQVSYRWAPPETGATALLCDIEGDGLDDVWLLTPDADGLFTVNIYRNEGGTWASSPSASTTSDRTLEGLQVFCADSDGDGLDELYLLKEKNSGLLGIPNVSGSLDWDGMVRGNTSLDPDSDWLPADYNGDGKDELGVFLGTTLSVWSLGGTTIAASSPLYEVATSGADGVVALDANADGLADLGLWNGTSLVVYAGTGTGIDSADKSVFAIGGAGRSFGADVR